MKKNIEVLKILLNRLSYGMSSCSFIIGHWA